MARSANQKLKLLYLCRILMEQTDEDHPLSVQELIAQLAQYNIQAERKSIYDDLDALARFGVDVQCRKGRSPGWFVGGRDFELPELKLLVDAVQSSKFISQKKSNQLIAKLEQLTSVHEAARLQRQVYVAGRVKTMNERVYYTIDAIHDAIAAGVRVRFRYFDYNVTKEKVYRRAGAEYEVSPYALLWDDENYYLVAYDAASEAVRHYRVDKMDQLSATALPRLGADAFAHFDLGLYSKAHFGMFSGREAQVTLRCANHFVGVMLDRFGRDLSLIPDGDGHFTITAPVAVSPQFFGWLCGLGPEVELCKPESVRAEFSTYLRKIAAVYEGDGE